MTYTAGRSRSVRLDSHRTGLGERGLGMWLIRLLN